MFNNEVEVCWVNLDIRKVGVFNQVDFRQALIKLQI